MADYRKDLDAMGESLRFNGCMSEAQGERLLRFVEGVVEQYVYACYSEGGSIDVAELDVQRLWDRSEADHD